MLMQWIKLRKNGDIETYEEELPDGYWPSTGDGKLLDGVSYAIIGHVKTPHLEHKRHVFIHESD